MVTPSPSALVDKYQTISFSRQSLAYDDKGRLYLPHNARYRPGKFGQALWIEEAATNLLKPEQAKGQSPSTGQINPYFDGQITVGSQEDAWEGRESVKVDTSIVAGDGHSLHGVYFLSPVYTDVPAGWYTVSAWVKMPPGIAFSLWLRGVRLSNGTNFEVGATPFTGIGDWQRVSSSFNVLDVPQRIGPQITVAGTESVVFYVDGAMAHRGAYPLSFTPDSRSYDNITFPTAGVLNGSEGTIEFWTRLNTLKPNAVSTPQEHAAFITSGDALFPGPRFLLMMRTATRQVNWWDGDGSTEEVIAATPVLNADTWYHVAAVWSSAGRRLLINGVLGASNTRSVPAVFNPIARIGGWQGFGGYRLDGLIDDLRISNVARSDADILAGYNSGQPLPADAATTLKLSFDGPDSMREARALVLGGVGL